MSLGVQNRLLAELLRHWDLDCPDVLAHDFGGATALRSYFLDGLRYRTLTIFDAVALRPWGSPFVAHVRLHEAAFSGLPAYAHDALLRAYLQGAAYGPLGEEAYQAYMSPWQREVGQTAFYRQIAQMDQRYTDEIEDRYELLDCPVTVLWGVQDEYLTMRKRPSTAEFPQKQKTTGCSSCSCAAHFGSERVAIKRMAKQSIRPKVPSSRTGAVMTLSRRP